MDYIRLLSNSFDYTKEALWGRWVRWLLLLVSVVIFPLIYGYSLRVMSGTKPAPELEGWIGLFVDGIKLIVITIVYAIPVWVLAIVGLAAYFIPVSTTTTPGVCLATQQCIRCAYFIPVSTTTIPGSGPETGIFVLLALLIVFIIFAVVIGILSTFAMVRFARTGRMGEAFRVRALVAHIGEIGWLNVFIALVVLTVVLAIVELVLVLVPLIGVPLLLLLTPAFIIFVYRYIALIYESAPAPA